MIEVKRHKTSPFEWSWSNPLFGYKMVIVKLNTPEPVHQIRLVKTHLSSENLRDFYIMKWLEKSDSSRPKPTMQPRYYDNIMQ